MTLCLKIFVVGVVCAATVSAFAQNASASTPDVVQLNEQLQQTRAELADSKKQIEELRRSVEELRHQLMPGHVLEPAPASAGEPSAAAADQDVGFLAAKIGELHQDKVESASKYPVKISGLVLFNSYWNKGILDIQDLPNLALPSFPGAPAPSVGATLRQTTLGVSATGPKLFGARSSAEAEIDFAGGSPTTAYGVTAGLLRLRTAKVSLDWTNTTLSFGQDKLFFSPLSPTSYATVLEPAMAWSGNLWVWTPEIELEHRVDLGERSSLVLQGGVLDPLTEEIPPFQGREPTAGEASRAPALGGRVAIDRASASSLPFTLGVGGYYTRQRYPGFDEIDSWTFNTDLKFPLGKR